MTDNNNEFNNAKYMAILSSNIRKSKFYYDCNILSLVETFSKMDAQKLAEIIGIYPVYIVNSNIRIEKSPEEIESMAIKGLICWRNTMEDSQDLWYDPLTKLYFPNSQEYDGYGSGKIPPTDNFIKSLDIFHHGSFSDIRLTTQKIDENKWCFLGGYKIIYPKNRSDDIGEEIYLEYFKDI